MRHYFSADGLVRATSKDITHVCVAPSLFSFLLYQLLSDEKTAKEHTYYFVDAVPKCAQDQLMATAFVTKNDNSIKYFIQRRLHKINIALFKTLKYPFLRKAELYAFDCPCINLYIGNRPYYFLADAPNCIAYNMQENSEEYRRIKRKSNSVFGKLQKLIYGDVYVDYYSTNKWCKALYLTEENSSPVLQNKKVIIKPLKQMWEEASESKKKYILNLFNLSLDDLQIINSKPMVFFTQPLREDCGVNDEEYADIMQRVLSRYDIHDVMIKTHPRDRFPYNKYFPDLMVFDKPANSQFLQLLGWQPERVGTFFSTAIDSFPETIECDYFGVNIHPRVKERYGEYYQPQRKVNRIQI